MDAAAALKRGEYRDLSAFTEKERKSLHNYVHSDPVQTHFDRLSLAEKLTAYDQATPDERLQYKLRSRIPTPIEKQRLEGHDVIKDDHPCGMLELTEPQCYTGAGSGTSCPFSKVS